MNSNLEFENEDPDPDNIEDNHPRTNYGEGFDTKPHTHDIVQEFPIHNFMSIEPTD